MRSAKTYNNKINRKRKGLGSKKGKIINKEKGYKGKGIGITVAVSWSNRNSGEKP